MSLAPDTNPERTARYRAISRGIVLATALVWAVYDLFPVLNAGRGDTISENIRDWSRTAWSLPFVWGALTSHLFANIGQSPNYRALFGWFAALTCTLILANLLVYGVWGWEAPAWARIVLLVLGVVSGLFLWSQAA